MQRKKKERSASGLRSSQVAENALTRLTTGYRHVVDDVRLDMKGCMIVDA